MRRFLRATALFVTMILLAACAMPRANAGVSAADFGASFVGDSASTVFTFLDDTIEAKGAGMQRIYYAKAQPSKKYLFSADIKLLGISPQNTESYPKAGILAGRTDDQAFVEFFFDPTIDEMVSHISKYNLDLAIGAGWDPMVKPAELDLYARNNITAIRDGKLFYYLVNNRICYIKEFTCGASQPGLVTFGMEAEYSNISYSVNESEIDQAIEQAMVQLKGFGKGAEYGNFTTTTVISESELDFSGKYLSGEYTDERFTQIATTESYSGDFTVEFTVSNITYDTKHDTGSSLYPRFDIIFPAKTFNPDRICIGPTAKQDRFETFMYTEMPQWYNHGDFTGTSGTASKTDFTEEHTVKIERREAGGVSNFTVYFDGVMVAKRMSGVSGAVKVGFSTFYVSAHVSNLSITPMEVA